MYNGPYDDYIRSILGYSSFNSTDNYNREYEGIYDNYREDALEEFYPEIYKIVYPMVAKVCDNNREMISKECIQKMTDEVYFRIESNNETIQQENRTTNNNSKELKTTVKESINRENRQFRNTNLRDLIQILIIRELLKKRRFPQRIPRPPRQAFPGRQGGFIGNSIAPW